MVFSFRPKSYSPYGQYHITGFCHEDFNVVSHRIRNIKIRYIFYLVTLLREIL